MADDAVPRSAEEFAQACGATSVQLQDMTAFRALIEDGSAKMNLVGPSALQDFWGRHAWDSAQLFHVEQAARVWADVGAGAGFPGVVLAILLKGRSGACVHLIESMGKRAHFLRHAVDALGLPAHVHHLRAEAFATPPGLEIVTARACAPLPRLLGFTAHLLRAGVKGLFLKGRDAEAELTDARRSWTFHADLIESRSDPSGRIVRIERLAPRVPRP